MQGDIEEQARLARLQELLAEVDTLLAEQQRAEAERETARAPGLREYAITELPAAALAELARRRLREQGIEA